MSYPTGDILTGCRRLIIDLPDDSVFTRAVVGQLSELGFPNIWADVGDVSPQDAAAYFDALVRDLVVYQCGDEPMALPEFEIIGRLIAAGNSDGDLAADETFVYTPNYFSDNHDWMTWTSGNTYFSLSSGWYTIEATCQGLITGRSMIEIYNDTAQGVYAQSPPWYYGTPHCKAQVALPSGADWKIRVWSEAGAVGGKGNAPSGRAAHIFRCHVTRWGSV